MSFDYHSIDADTLDYEFEVLTVLPHADEPEYRSYLVDANELPELIQDINDPKVAQMVVDIKAVEI